MPIDKDILGFGNIWYKAAIEHAQDHLLDKDLSIKAVSAPYFIATKIEALKTRGKMDYFASHDFEDIVSVVDGRQELKKELKNADSRLKQYLQQSFETMMKDRDFHDALPGHFIQYGSLSKARIDLFLENLEWILKN